METTIIDREATKRVQKEAKTVTDQSLASVNGKTETKLSTRQHRVIYETVQAIASTHNNVEASIKLGISEVAFYKRINTYPQIKAGIARIKERIVESVKDRIVFTAPQLADNTIDLANNANSETVKLQANLELLAIGGIQKAPQNNIQVNVLNQLNKDSKDFDIG